ncbi:MAG: FecCD family ABC transporter permease [Sulfuricurvum sp.]
MRNNLPLFIALAFTLYSPFLGAIPLDFAAVFEPSSLEHKIFFEIRLPRLLFAFSAGVILSLSGLVYQTLFRNPLMTPYTLGISSGAVLGAGIAIKLSLGTLVLGIGMVSIFGFFGAMATVFLLLYLSRFLHASHQHALLLLGIALSLFYTSALMVVFYLGDAMQNDMLIRFTMGSLSVIGWQHPLVLGIIAALFTIAVMLWRFELELMGISEQGALLRGVDTKRLTLLLLLVSSFGIGVLVSISGPIGFVGLIVPHIVAKLYPVSLKHRILKTALFGGFFLLFCDTLTRALPTQSELPIGIITALFGAPFFIYLLIAKTKN